MSKVPNIVVWFTSYSGFTYKGHTYSVATNDEMFNAMLDDGKMPTIFYVKDINTALSATPGVGEWDIYSSGRLPGFFIDGHSNAHEVRFSGINSAGKREETRNLGTIATWKDRKAYVVGEKDAFTNFDCEEGSASNESKPENGPGWFDPKLPKRIDII
jgi:hypothetical protein